MAVQEAQEEARLKIRLQRNTCSASTPGRLASQPTHVHGLGQFAYIRACLSRWSRSEKMFPLVTHDTPKHNKFKTITQQNPTHCAQDGHHNNTPKNMYTRRTPWGSAEPDAAVDAGAAIGKQSPPPHHGGAPLAPFNWCPQDVQVLCFYTPLQN